MPLRPEPEIPTDASTDRMDFTVQCRSARTPSPTRPRTDIAHGPYERSRSGETVRTGRFMTLAQIAATARVVDEYAAAVHERYMGRRRPSEPDVPPARAHTSSVRGVPRREASRSRDADVRHDA